MKFSVVKLLTLLLFFVSLILLNQSCKKVKDESQENKEVSAIKHPLEAQFFQIAENTPVVVKKIASYLESRKNKSAIAAKIISEVGLPAWDKSIIANKSAVASCIANRNTIAENDSNYVFVPIVPNGTTEVNGALACLVTGDSVYIKYLDEKKYKQYGFDSTNVINAESLVWLMVYLQNKAYGTKDFVINDGRLFSNSSATADSLKKKNIRIKNNDTTTLINNSNASVAGKYIVAQECTEIMVENCHGALCPGNPAYVPDWNCVSLLIWVDEDNSDNFYLQSLPPDNIGSGGGGGYTYNEEPPSVSVPFELSSTFGLTEDEFNFVAANPDLSNEIFGYINTELEGETYATVLLRNQALLRVVSLAKSHLDYLRSSQGYFNFCKSRVQANILQTGGWSFEWFSKFVNNTDIDLTGLNDSPCAQQIASTIIGLNNSTISTIKDLFGESAKYNIKFTIDANLTVPGNTSMTPAYYKINNAYGEFVHLNINIKINPEHIANSTKISIAQTIIHEMLHAYYFYRSVDANGDAQKEIDLANELGFLRPYDPNASPAVYGNQHEQMAANYIAKMAEALKEFKLITVSDLQQIKTIYPNLDLDTYYTAMAWAGLTGDTNGFITKAWETFQINEPTKAQMYKVIIATEENATSLAASKEKC